MPASPKPPPADVDAYIAALSPEVRSRAGEVRAAIRAALPEAEEIIAYGMPAYRIGRARIIHFAVWKKHVGLYPVYRGGPDDEAAIAPYRAAKDTVQFKHARPLPTALVTRMAELQKARCTESG